MYTFENLRKANYKGVGCYDIPEIPRFEVDGGLKNTEFIPYNFVNTCNEPERRGVHFFLDDRQFVRVWRSPGVYIEKLRRFRFVLAPDYSLYTDMPRALQIYNHYRKHWLARYWSESGISVIPTISWSTPDSFFWCFDGEPRGSVVAVSTVGCMNDGVSKELFFLGFEEMKRVLEPSVILCYGAEIEGTVNIKPYYLTVKERAENGRARG